MAVTPRTVLLPRMSVRAWYGKQPPDVPDYEVVPLSAALTRACEGEACMVPYAPPLGVDRYPRLGKASLAHFELRPDEMPAVEVVPVDIDFPNHDVPPEDWHLGILDLVDWPCGWYRTPHGMRLVFLPAEPVPLSVANDYIRRLHDHLHDLGIETDPTTRNWYRLFKVPRALNRDLPRDFDGMTPLEWHPDDLVASLPADIGPIVARDQADADPERKITRRDLKPLGKDSRLADDLYHGRLAAPEGHRHGTLLAAAGDIVSAFDSNDPLLPFELLAASATKMGKGLSELWRICEWIAAAHSGEKEAREEDKLDVTLRSAEAMEVRPEEVRRRLIIDAGSEWFVWDEELLAYTAGRTQGQILNGLARHCPRLAGDFTSGDHQHKVLMRDLATTAEKVVYTYIEDEAGYDPWTSTITVCTVHQDRSLEPTYHHDVQQWLDQIFQRDRRHVLDWLSAVPELEAPVCALYVDGPNSIGKGMLAAGIARLWSREKAVTPYSSITGRFNESLKYAPLIHADEKVPQDAFANNDSSVFRRIIGNDGIRIEGKGKPLATLRGYPRVLITANNQDALDIREELDAADLAAIRVRIGYIYVPPERGDAIKAWLKAKTKEAGFELIRDYTSKWVEGGAIAEHILWLQENRVRQPAGRFLVEGWESALTEDLATSVGSAGTVAETVALAVSQNHDGQAVRWFDDHVYVNTTTLAAEWRYILGHDVDRAPTSQQRLKALKSLSLDTKVRLDVPGSERRRQRNYWRIPAETIARLAEQRNICDASVVLEACSRKNEPVEEVILGIPESETVSR